MRIAHIPVSDELLAALGRTAEEFDSEVRMLVAASFVQQRRLSIGRAAELAGMRKSRFIEALTTLGIPVINLDDEQIGDELRDP